MREKNLNKIKIYFKYLVYLLILFTIIYLTYDYFFNIVDNWNLLKADHRQNLARVRLNYELVLEEKGNYSNEKIWFFIKTGFWLTLGVFTTGALSFWIKAEISNDFI